MTVRMRTLDGLYDEIHKADPGSEVTKYFLRQMLIREKVKVVHAGKKRLANLDEVLEYLRDPQEVQSEGTEVKPEGYGTLRKVAD